MNLKLVVLFIGGVLILATLGITFLAATAHSIPDVLQNLAVGSLTGLVGLLVPTKTRAE